MVPTYRSDISNKDVVLGHWDPNDKRDWRWYRHTDAYGKLFSAWNAHGGRALTLKALGFQSSVSDKNAFIYLGLKEGSALSKAQKDLAQAAYDRDLFDWWWTTQGLDVSYKDASGKTVILKSGVIITTTAVLTSNDVVLVDRPTAVLGLALMMKDSSGNFTKTEFGRLYRGTTKYQEPDRWWRETSWFKGLMNGSAKFEKIGGKSWNKSWGQTFLELSKTDLSKLPQGFQTYVKRVAKAINEKNSTELTACLETWLKQLPSVFAGVPKGNGYLVSDFLKAPLNLNSDMIDYQASNFASTSVPSTPRWATTDQNGKPKAATDDTHTLIVFGDSHSDRYHAGSMNSVWVAKLASNLSDQQQKLFRALNYAVSGFRTDQILLEIKALVADIAKISGKKTVVLAAGGNDTANDALNDGRSADRARYQTNTLANLREATLLLASYGINVILFKVGNATLQQLQAIAEEVNAKFPKNKANAINLAPGFDVKNYSQDGSHLNAAGHAKLAEWLSKQPAFAETAFPPASVKPAPIVTDPATWWRTSQFFKDIIFATAGWSKFWIRDDGFKADKNYATKVYAAYEAYKNDVSSKNYNAIAALLEQWLDGTIGKAGDKHAVENYYGGSKFIFGPDAVRLSGKTEPYLKNPNYKAPPKADPATWWRTSQFFKDIILAKDGWRKFWTGADGLKADDGYAKKVTAAYKAYENDDSPENYNAIAALLEKWLDGTIRGKTTAHTVEHYYNGSKFIFSSDMVRLSGKTEPYLKNPNYKAPPKADPATWWRTSQFFKDIILAKDGWSKFWTGEDGFKADKDYATKVSTAYAAYAKVASTENYNAIAAQLEKWLDGTIRGKGKAHTVENYYGGSRFIFGPDAVRLSGKKEPYLTNTDYEAPPKADPATWWRTSQFFQDIILAKDGWSKFWTGEDGFKADKDYATKVSTAYAAYAKVASTENYNAIAAQLEKWLDGTIRGKGKAHTVENYYDGSRFIFGPDMLRLSGKTEPYLKNPDDKNTKKQILVIGDSLSDGDWEKNDAVWSRLLPDRLIKEGYLDYEMHEQAKAGICTRTANGKIGAKERLTEALAVNPHPAIVVIGIGVNNYANGISLADTDADINWMVEAAQKTDAKVLLLGMYLPPGLRGDELTKTDKDWLKANGISETGRDAWSKGLQKITENIARKNAGDKSFSYLPNYWDPIDGDDNQLDPDELQGTKDSIHPALKDQQAIFEQVWKSLSVLKSGKEIAIEPTPELIKKFKGSKRNAGQDPILTFELAKEISAGAKFDLKYWAKINDKDAGDQNGMVPNAAGYVNYKRYFVRYDEKDPWVEFAYTSKSQLVATKNTRKIYLRFETYRQTPYSYDLMVNLGGKNYSVFIEDNLGSKLYIKDSKNEPARHASDVRQHQDSNTCYLLAALQAATTSIASNDYLATLITEDSQNFYVKFKDYDKLTITKKEVTTELWNKEAARLGSKGEELWVRVLELAYLRAAKSSINDDGSPLKPLQMFTGKEVSEITGGNAGANVVDELLRLQKAGNASNHHYIVVGTHNELESSLKDLRANHAYAVTAINDDGTYRLWDPIGGVAKNITKAQLEKISERFFITDFKKGDINPSPKYEDQKGKWHPNVPKFYMRATVTGEHKQKEPRDYYKILNNGRYGDGKNVTDSQLRGRLKSIPERGLDDEDDWCKQESYKEHTVREFVTRHTAAQGDGSRLKPGTEYYKIELYKWAPGENLLQLSSEIFIADKKEVRNGESLEITMGIDTRFFVGKGDDRSDIADSFRIGPVAAATFNSELLITYTNKGGSTTGDWARRYRSRFSVAAEAVGYSKPFDKSGGATVTVRLRYQVQAGLINDDWSIWFGLASELAATPYNFGNTEDSLNSMIESRVRGDKRDFNKTLAAFLSKFVNTNVYFGLNGLGKDKVKTWAQKIIGKRDPRFAQLINLRTREQETKNPDEAVLAIINAGLEAVKESRPTYIFRQLTEYFHNFKWKVEAGGIWFPVGYDTNKLTGDGRYAGGGGTGAKSWSDSIWDMLGEGLSYKDKIDGLIEKADIKDIAEILPPNIAILITSLMGEKFDSAVTSQMLKIDKMSSDNGGGAFRGIAKQLSSEARTLLMVGIYSQVQETVIDWVESIVNGGTFKLPDLDAQGKLVGDYEAYLVGLAPELLSAALARVFSSSNAMVSMLLYAGTLVATEAVGRFVDELAEKKFGEKLTDEQKKTVKTAAQAQDYKRFGVKDEIAKDLANDMKILDLAKKHNLDGRAVADINNKIYEATVARSMRSADIDANAAMQLAKGKSFDAVADELKWTDDQRVKVAADLDKLASFNSTPMLSDIADSAYRRGLGPEGLKAYDLMRAKDPAFTRSLARNIAIKPESLAEFIDNLAPQQKGNIKNALRELANANPGNDVLQTAKANFVFNFTAAQKAISNKIYSAIKQNKNLTEAKSREIANSIARDDTLSKLSGSNLNEAIDRAIANTNAFTDAASKSAAKNPNFIKNGVGGVAGAVLDFIPLIIGIATNSAAKVKDSIGTIATGIGLTAFALAMGPVGWAFEVLVLAMGLAGGPVNKLVDKNKLYLLIPVIGITWAFNQGLNIVNKAISTTINALTGVFGRTKGVLELPGLNMEAAIYAIYWSEYNLAYYDAYNNKELHKPGEDRVAKSKSAASAAVMLRLVTDGVITADSFAAAMSGKEADASKFVYQIDKISPDKLAEGIAWEVLRSVFDVDKDFTSGTGDALNPIELAQTSKQKDTTNRAILAAVINKLANNETSVDRDQTRFFATWNNGPDIFQTDHPSITGGTAGGYSFVGEFKYQNDPTVFANKTRMAPSAKLVNWAKSLTQIGMLRYVKNSAGQYVLEFGNDLYARDVPNDKRNEIGRARRDGLVNTIMYYATHHGEEKDNKNANLSFNELTKAFNDMGPGRQKAISVNYVKLLVSLRLGPGILNKSFNHADVKELVYAAQGKDKEEFIVFRDVWGFKADGNWGIVGKALAPTYDLSRASTDILVNRIIDVYGDAKREIGADKLADAASDLELIPNLTNYDDEKDILRDAKDILNFALKGIEGKNEDEDNKFDGWSLSHLFNQGVFKRQAKDPNAPKLDLSRMTTNEIAQAITKMSGSKDGVIDAEELMRALNYLLPGNPYKETTEGWYYEDLNNLNNPLDDISNFIQNSGLGENVNGWRFQPDKLKEAIANGKFYQFLKTRVPESSLKWLPGDPNYAGPRPASLAPVVLDLDGDGLNFTPLASSVAHYDVDDSGVRRNLAWTKDALLAFDADGDGAITRTNELSFVGYKEGAKTDLEGLTAFDSNGDGKLSVLDKYWKKFVAWLDRNSDGVSDAGELVTLDKAGIASIDLTSDKKRQDLNGVTLHGTTTFTTTDGRKGTVGDVSFDVSKSTLSAAEIARRRDLLAQALASRKPASAAGVFTSTVTNQHSLNLFMPGGGGR